MATTHVTLSVIMVIVRWFVVVRGQVDMFSLHDSQRGDVSMHVTRESAQIEAIADSVSLVMNPQGAAGGGFARSYNDNATQGGGYTIGNIGQPQVTMKEDTAKKPKGSANDRSELSSRDNHVIDHADHVTQRTNQMEALPLGNKLIHVAQDDFNVRRSRLPSSAHAHKRSKLKQRKYKRHYRPRPPCNSDVVTATKKTTKDADRFEMLGDFNEIMEQSSVRRKRDWSSHRARKSRGRSRGVRRRSTGDTRREGELYNIHDGRRPLMRERRSCGSPPKEKRDAVTLKEYNRFVIRDRNSQRAVRSSTEDEGRVRAKKSGVKEMKIHNELGGMHIKSDPQQTAVVSESGNIEITMLNDQGSLTQKKDSGGRVVMNNAINSQSSKRYETASSRTLKQNHVTNMMRPRARLHLAQDVSLKKSDISIDANSRNVVANI